VIPGEKLTPKPKAQEQTTAMTPLKIEERNRANAQHSTGPKTDAGKAQSSQNARTHGLNSVRLHVPPERQAEFGQLYQALADEIRPVGELQLQFFEQAVHASWNTNIARDLLAEALAARDDKRIANANRYVAQYERSFARALAELRKLQTDLAIRTLPENEPILALPLTCEIKRIGNEATKLARQAALQATRREKLSRVMHSFRLLTPRNAEKEQAAS
jgi:hypothetical protein